MAVLYGFREYRASLRLATKPKEMATGESQIATSLGVILAEKVLRHFAPVFGDLLDDLFVQPNIHLGGIVGIARVVQLSSEGFARGKTAVHFEQLQQVDDGLSPVKFLRVFGG